MSKENVKLTINKVTLPIRSALIPNYYKSFHCLMGACQDNCCDDGWRIEFSKKDYLAVKRVAEKDPELQEMVSQGMRRLRGRAHDNMYAEFCLTSEGRCAFHTDEGLCQLQLACGENTLPQVCRMYPRTLYYTTAAKEYCLSPSCEAVLQQLWDLPDGVEFVEEPLPKEERYSISISVKENLRVFFTPIRALCIDILQNRSMPLTQRMLCLGVVLQRLQHEDWASLDPDEWVASQWEQIISMSASFDVPGNRDMFLMQNINTLGKIVRAASWNSDIYYALKVQRRQTFIADKNGVFNQEKTCTVNYSKDAYQEALTQFEAVFSGHEYFFENLMVAVALYIGFPNLDSKEKMWKNYVSLCNLYSFYRFVSVLGCKGESTKERLFHMIVMASRATLHNEDRLDSFQEELFQNDSSTLAHMAILLKG